MRRSLHKSLRTQGAAVFLALLLFGAITVARFASSDASNALGFLYALPITLLAFRFGTRAGAASGLAACSLLAVWAEVHASMLDLLGYGVRLFVLVGVGGLVGILAERRERAESSASRWFSMSNDLLCSASFDGFFTAVNPAWEDCLGFSRAELVGRPYVEFVHPDDIEATLDQAAKLAAGPQAVANFENRYRAKNGEWHWLLWSARSDEHQVYAVAKDITERKTLEAALEALARNDELTGLANRRAWHERLRSDRERAVRAGTPLAVAVLDVDNLKQTNDEHGHEVGDRTLKAAAAALMEATREIDYVARLGGDEFGVLLPGCDVAAAEEVVSRMLIGLPEDVTFSAGIAVWDGTESTGALTARADQAMYVAKRGGRAGVSLSRETETPVEGDVPG